MKKNDFIISIFLGLTAFFSRIPLIEKFQSHWDGPQYTLAITQYSLQQETPGPPGYPIYIGLGKLINFLINDPYLSIILISIIGTALGAIMFFIGGKIIFNRITGLTASLIFLTGSTFYYFGLTPYAYILIPGMTMLLASIVYKIYIKKKKLGLLFGLIVGIYFGIRPQEIIQIGPLILLGLLFLNNKEKTKTVLASIFISLFWFIPLIAHVGLRDYVELSAKFAKEAFIKHTILYRLEIMLKGFLLSTGIAGLFLAYYLKFLHRLNRAFSKNIKIIILFTTWIIPGIIYNLFIRTEHAGYQMTYLSGLVLLISYAIYKVTYYNRYLLYITLFSVSAFNLYWFFYDRDPEFTRPYRPTSFHYSDIRKNDLKVGSKTNYIKNNFKPEETLLISTEVLWRPYSYHLKNYRIIAIYALENTAAPYKYNLHDSRFWKMKKTENKNKAIEIPSGIRYLIFMDDAAHSWIKNIEKRKISLPGNSTLSIYNIYKKSTIEYGYHTINITY